MSAALLASAALADQLLAAEGVTCPECGGSLTVDPTAEKEVAIAAALQVGTRPLEVRLVGCTVAFCNACEFAIEVQLG